MYLNRGCLIIVLRIEEAIKCISLYMYKGFGLLCTRVQITEMYSSCGQLHIELLTGQPEGAKALWVHEHVYVYMYIYQCYVHICLYILVGMSHLINQNSHLNIYTPLSNRKLVVNLSFRWCLAKN